MFVDVYQATHFDEIGKLRAGQEEHLLMNTHDPEIPTAKSEIVQKPYAHFLSTLVNLTSTPNWFEMLPNPYQVKNSTLR